MSIDYSLLPEHIQDGVRRYIEDKLPTGDFLKGVIENNLTEAICRADKVNLYQLREIVQWFYTYAPDPCWGSKEKREKWLRRKNVGEQGEKENPD